MVDGVMACLLPWRTLTTGSTASRLWKASLPSRPTNMGVPQSEGRAGLAGKPSTAAPHVLHQPASHKQEEPANRQACHERLD